MSRGMRMLLVTDKPPDDPEWLADFRLEQRRARRLLERADSLFPR